MPKIGRKRKTRRSLDQRATSGDGGQGDRTPRWERVLESRAMNAGWNISQKRRAKLVSRLFDTIESESATERDVIAASRVVIAADSLNVQRERQDSPSEHVHQHQVTGQIDVRGVVAHLQQDPAYVSYLNQQAIDRAAGIPLADGDGEQSGQMATGEASSEDR